MLLQFPDLEQDEKAPTNDYQNFLVLVETLYKKFKEMNNVSI